METRWLWHAGGASEGFAWIQFIVMFAMGSDSSLRDLASSLSLYLDPPPTLY